MSEKNVAKQQLGEVTEFDNAFRKAIVTLLKHFPMTKTQLTAVVSAMAWQLRQELTPEHLRQSEIMAQYVCTTRDIKDYPLGGMR